MFIFRGDYKFGYTYVNPQGVSFGGYTRRDLKKTWHVFLGGKERFIKRLVYPMGRHD